MNWISVKDKLPDKVGWYLTWRPGCSPDNWDPEKWINGQWRDATGVTHWLEVVGPEEMEKK